MLLYIALWIFFWFRPHFGFVATCVVVMVLLDWIFVPLGIAYVAATDPSTLLDLQSWLALPVEYVQETWRGFAIFSGVGAAIVGLRKWMKSRKPVGDGKLDDEMQRIRADIAAREAQPPTAQ
jgi:hypothetical protein